MKNGLRFTNMSPTGDDGMVRRWGSLEEDNFRQEAFGCGEREDLVGF